MGWVSGVAGPGETSVASPAAALEEASEVDELAGVDEEPEAEEVELPEAVPELEATVEADESPVPLPEVPEPDEAPLEVPEPADVSAVELVEEDEPSVPEALELDAAWLAESDAPPWSAAATCWPPCEDESAEDADASDFAAVEDLEAPESAYLALEPPSLSLLIKSGSSAFSSSFTPRLSL
jgi:hypothetical protein